MKVKPNVVLVYVFQFAVSSAGDDMGEDCVDNGCGMFDVEE